MKQTNKTHLKLYLVPPFVTVSYISNLSFRMIKTIKPFLVPLFLCHQNHFLSWAFLFKHSLESSLAHYLFCFCKSCNDHAPRIHHWKHQKLSQKLLQCYWWWLLMTSSIHTCTITYLWLDLSKLNNISTAPLRFSAGLRNERCLHRCLDGGVVDGGEGEGLACVGSLRYRYRSVPMQASASPSLCLSGI